MTETQEQIYLFRWAEVAALSHPEISLMFHIANERKCSEREGARFKLMGVRKGVSDVFLPVARNGYHGMWIEMKSKDGKPSDDQLGWLKQMSEQGYYGVVAYGWREAANEIEKYIGL